MPTIIKRGDRYLARVRKIDFSPVSQSFIRRADALSWGRRVEADMQAGRWSNPDEAIPSLKNAIVAYRAKVAAGMAWVYDKYVVDRSLYDVEVQAREARRGIWSQSAPVPPWEWRRMKRGY